MARSLEDLLQTAVYDTVAPVVHMQVVLCLKISFCAVNMSFNAGADLPTALVVIVLALPNSTVDYQKCASLLEGCGSACGGVRCGTGRYLA